MLATLGVERAVLVQPSVYGTDNTVMLQALREAGPAFRGVAVVDWDIADREIESLHALGVRGVRVNVVDVKEGGGALPVERLRGLAGRIAPRGWHVELLAHVDGFPALDRDLADFPADVVFGHLGYMRTERGAQAPGFRALVRLLEAGRAWVKLTGPYRISAGAMPHADVAAFARELRPGRAGARGVGQRLAPRHGEGRDAQRRRPRGPAPRLDPRRGPAPPGARRQSRAAVRLLGSAMAGAGRAPPSALCLARMRSRSPAGIGRPKW